MARCVVTTDQPRSRVPALAQSSPGFRAEQTSRHWLSRDKRHYRPIRGQYSDPSEARTMDKLMQHKLDELHLTQLNLVLLNNFYKQIYEGGKSFKNCLRLRCQLM